MDFDSDIITAKKCPYCGGKPEFVNSREIYKRDYGMIYLCRECRAYVGVHKGTKKALGRLANWELRKAKVHAHQMFDNLWKQKMARGFAKGEARRSAYKWLSQQLDIPVKYTHIGMFDVATCKKVVQICKPYFKTIPR